MLSRQKLGYKFEDLVHELISQTSYPVLREKEIINTYGILSYGIDHLINLPEYIVCIQDKWRDTKTQLSDINHFIKSCDKVHEAENKKCVGIYLTKIEITKGALEAFEYENYKQKNFYLSLFDSDMNQLLKKLSYLMYSNQIYFIDPDGSTIMLD
jgi:hypothetical protein